MAGFNNTRRRSADGPHLLLAARFTCAKYEETVDYTEWLRPFRWLELRKMNTSFHTHISLMCFHLLLMYNIYTLAPLPAFTQPHAATVGVAISWPRAQTKTNLPAEFKNFELVCQIFPFVGCSQFQIIIDIYQNILMCFHYKYVILGNLLHTIDHFNLQCGVNVISQGHILKALPFSDHQILS